ncbi:MAG TPA: GspMb/PilO family protein [Gemmatimonadaceae bacterium]|nr:GspMb/PilO family protein [Gemmatimonadaceae bacterium]
MSWSTMSSKDRRAIVLGAAIVMPALLFIWGVRPYRAALAETRDELEIARLALSREKAAVTTTRANPGAQRSADSALMMTAPRLFEGRDDAIASAQLASYLGTVARRSRVLMQDANTRPSSTSPEGIRTLRVEVRAESDIQGITTFLHNLESGQKLVRVDRLEISRVPGLEERNEFETLSIAATIVGFAFEASAPASPAATPLATPPGGRR